MINEYEYQKEKYTIIEAIKIYGIDFVISKNNKNEITYMKITQLTHKTVFTPLDNLIKVLEAYNNPKIINIKRILDYFTYKLNKNIRKDRIKIYDTNQIIINFNGMIKELFPIINNKITNKDLKKIDKFISKYESKPKRKY